MRFQTLIVCALSILAAPAFAQTFGVTGVGPADSLNIRADLDRTEKASHAKIIGRIPHDGTGITATGISLELNKSRWREIIYKGVKGWVNSSYLQEIGGVGMPDNLDCGGTEPFWDLYIRNNKAELKDPGLDQPTKFVVAEKRHGVNRSGLWSFHLATDKNKSAITAVIFYTDRCSVGMGNLQYAFQIYLLGMSPQQGPVQGCCSFAR